MSDPKTNPFAKLAALRETLPRGPTPASSPAPGPAAEKPKPAEDLGEKLVVSRSKKGRGGKTVTTIAGVRDTTMRDKLALELRRALGCGSTVEDELVIVQGDQVQRVRAHLEARGVRKIIIGT